MTFNRTQLRNLSPAAEKFLKDFDGRKVDRPKDDKPIEHVPLLKGWTCENGHTFDYPLRVGVGICPVCRGPVKYVGEQEPGATEPDNPSYRQNIDNCPPLIDRLRNPRELTGPVMADDEFFKQPVSADTPQKGV